MPALLILALLLWPGAAAAHGAAAQEASTPWTFDPWIVIPLALAALGYAAGALRLMRRSGAPRIRVGQIAAYAAGWLALAGALTSPLHWLGERLFSVHMIEHEIVMAVAAPLMVAARPLPAFLWSLPRRPRQRAARLLRSAPSRALWAVLAAGGTATLLHGAAIWGWHAPALFDRAVTDVAYHRLQHLSFFLTAVLFWWAVLWRCEAGVGAFHLFVTMLHTSVLGALMALSPRVLYAAQAADALRFGLTPLEDQQLAGVLMWVPAGTVYAGAALALLALWIRRAGEGSAPDAVRAR